MNCVQKNESKSRPQVIKISIKGTQSGRITFQLIFFDSLQCIIDIVLSLTREREKKLNEITTQKFASCQTVFAPFFYRKQFFDDFRIIANEFWCCLHSTLKSLFSFPVHSFTSLIIATVILVFMCKWHFKAFKTPKKALPKQTKSSFCCWEENNTILLSIVVVIRFHKRPNGRQFVVMTALTIFQWKKKKNNESGRKMKW